MNNIPKMFPKLKLLLLFGYLLIHSITAHAQQKSPMGQDVKNEFNANLLGLAIGLPELSYQRLINEKMAIGIAAAVGIQNAQGEKQPYKFMITPHYHYYFGKKYANGFFLEANVAVFSDEVPQAGDGGVSKEKIYYGLGGAVGVKQVFAKGFVAELLLGIGSKLNNNPVKNQGVDLGLYRRVGLSIGKRF